MYSHGKISEGYNQILGKVRGGKKKPMNMPGNKRKLDTHSELQIAIY